MITSPLTRLDALDSSVISAYQAIGIATNLAMAHSDYESLDVENIVERVHAALNIGCAKIFFDGNHRPYGYASWVKLSTESHRTLVEGNTKITLSPKEFFNSEAGSNLWFFDFICPFSSSLLMLRTLKGELSDYADAFLLPTTNHSAQVRRLW